MFEKEYTFVSDFPALENFIELRALVTELEFKREELNRAMDSLQKAVNSISQNISHTVNE